jgi:hypothetical protein
MTLLKITGFTIIEVVGLVVWLILAGLPFGGHYAAVIVLAVILEFEHITAYNVGKGAPFFSIPR